MDTMENYKSYLEKTHNLQKESKNTFSVREIYKTRAKTIDQDNLECEIKTAIGRNENKELSIIKEKIDRIKTL
jgi:hypothetical protein